MSHKDNQDLRPRGEGGWGWEEHELYTVFVPLIGPMGAAVYKTMTRLVPLVAADPYRYDFSSRRISAWSGVSKSTAAKFLRMICDLGMVVETKYLDGRDPSYKLPSLRELAKVGEDELKRRIGVRVADTSSFDFREKNKAQIARQLEKRRKNDDFDQVLPLLDGAEPMEDVVRVADNTAEDGRSGDVVRVADTLSAVRAMLSAPEPMLSAGEAKLSATRTPNKEEENDEESKDPLPPALQGEVGRDDPDKASPSLPTPGVVYGDAGFPQSLPVAAAWVMSTLGISDRRLQPSVMQQLELWCKRNRDATLESAAMHMERQGRLLHEHADRLRHRPWGWKKFIEQGHWTRPLPYATPEARDLRLAAVAAIGMSKPDAHDAVDHTALTREYLLKRSEAVASNPVLVPFADEIRAISDRYSPERYEEIESELRALQDRMAQALFASLSSEDQERLNRAADMQLVVAKQRVRNLSPDDSARYRAKELRVRLTSFYGLPTLSLFDS